MIESSWRRAVVHVLLGSALLSGCVAGGVASADTGSTSAGSSGSGSGSASGSGSGSASGSDSGSAVLPVSSFHGMGALGAAATQVGKPYEWGAMGPNSWDCSALVQWAFSTVGVHIPRTTWEQARAGVSVPRYALAPGDVLILNSDASHVGIYAGFGQVLNAYDYGVPVGLTPLNHFVVYSIRRF